MPTYEYRCDNGHEFEVLQRMGDDPVSVCEVCDAPVRRVFSPVAVHFKGSGFYNTDYGTRKRSREKESAEASKSEGAKDSKGSKESTSDSSSKSDSSGSKSDSGGSSSASKAAAAD